jgi:hypothetical protein
MGYHARLHRHDLRSLEDRAVERPAAAATTAMTLASAIGNRAFGALIAREGDGVVLGGVGVGHPVRRHGRAVLARQETEAPKDQWTEAENAHFKREYADQKAKAAAIAGGYRLKVAAHLAEAEAYFKAEDLQRAVEGFAPKQVAAEFDTRPVSEREPEVARALMAAWMKVFGRAIPQRAMAVLIGKWRAECTKGQANFNIGNLQYKGDLKTGPSDPSSSGGTRDVTSDYAWRSTPEQKASGDKPSLSSFYAAYNSLEEGAIGLLRRLTTQTSMHAALGALIFGKGADDYVWAAFGGGYFQAPVLDIRSPEAGARLLKRGYLTLVKATMPAQDKLVDEWIDAYYSAGGA